MLTENEWIAINQMLLELYSIRNVDELSQRVMKMFRRMVPYTSGYFLQFDLSEKIDETRSFFVDMPEEVQQMYLDYYYNIDYLNYIIDFAKETAVYRDTDILEDEERCRTEFYLKFLKPQNIPYGCGIILYKDRSLKGIVNLFRSEEMGDFTDKHIYILNVLKLHLSNILEGLTGEIKNLPNKNQLHTSYGLSFREQQVAELIMTGASNQKISQELDISLSTVKKHVYNIYEKTKVKSRTELSALFHT